MKTSTENNNSITNKQTASIKCIDCSRVPKIQINYNNPEYLNIKCNCSINKQIKIKDYLIFLQKEKPTASTINKSKIFCKKHLYHVNDYFCLHCQKNMCNLCLEDHKKHQYILYSNYCNSNKVKTIQNNMTEAETFLSLYNMQLKENLIKQLRKKIEIIENAYNQNYEINSSLLQLTHIITDAFISLPNNFNSMFNLLNNTTFNFTKINPLSELSDKTINHLVEYYKSNYIIVKPSQMFSEDTILLERKKEHVDLSKLTQTKTIFDNSSYINCLLVLEDGRIASCFGDKTIKIFNIESGKCDIVLKKKDHSPVFLSQLDKCKIMSCSIEGNIIIWNINKIFFSVEKIIEEHTDSVWKVISISKNRIASCSYDTTIKIYNKFPPYSLIATMSGNDLLVCSIIQIKGKELLVSASDDTKMIFWNLSSYKMENSIMGIDCSGNMNLVQIDRNRIISGGIEGIYVVNFRVFQKEAYISNKDLGYDPSVLLLRDKTLLCSGNGGNIIQYDLKSFKCAYQSKIHMNKIMNLVRIKDNAFICSSEDNIILLFEY